MGTWYASALSVPAPPAPRRLGLINWRVVAWAGGAALFLVAGVVGAVLLVDHRAHAALKKADPNVVMASASRRSESAHQVEPVHRTSGDQKTDSAQASMPPIVVYLPPAVPAEQPGLSGPGELPASEQTVTAAAIAFENFGTQLAFAATPAEAAREAVKERKLLFTVHLAGNFEDCKFT